MPPNSENFPTDPITDPSLAAEAQNALSISLMGKIATGDAQAFQSLVEIHQGAVVGTAFRMLGHREDALDLAQQLFLRIWKSAPRYQATAKFTTWMFTILRNLAANEVRRQRAKPVSSMDEAVEGYGLQIIDHQAPLADAALDKQEMVEAIDAAIASLPEQQRLAVSLRRHQDLAYEEIAEILGTSVSSVKSLLFRARTSLRETLAEWM